MDHDQHFLVSSTDVEGHLDLININLLIVAAAVAILVELDIVVATFVPVAISCISGRFPICRNEGHTYQFR